MISHIITKRIKPDVYRFFFKKDPSLIGDLTVTFKGFFRDKYYQNFSIEINKSHFQVDVPKSVYLSTRRFEYVGNLLKVPSGQEKNIKYFKPLPYHATFEKVSKFEDLWEG